MSHRIPIVLVHGTHDIGEGAWWRPNSSFADMVSEHGFRQVLTDGRAFEWSGDIGQFFWDKRDWDAASDSLRDHLLLHCPNPRDRFLVAHSHGGAIALKTALQIPIAGLLTVGTPVRPKVRQVGKMALEAGHIPLWWHCYDDDWDWWQWLGGGRGGFKLPGMQDCALEDVGHSDVLKGEWEIVEQWMDVVRSRHGR